MKQSFNPGTAAAGIFGFLGVVLGAFGAHALQNHLSPQAMDWWQTGVLYHLIHAAVLLAAASFMKSGRTRVVVVGAFSTGILLFSGSLYLMALTHFSVLGFVTPVGGVLFLVGWAAVLISAFFP